MSNGSPSPRSNPNEPMYLVAIAIGSIALVVGAVLGVVLYREGGAGLATIGVVIALLTFVIGLNRLLSLRDKDGQEP